MSPRIFRRVPYETAVRFEFDRFRGFVEEHSADLSLGGMFVKTRTVPPVGTVVPIEFRLDDGYELIRGTGKVIWVREEDEGPGRPAGMGLRFLELTAGSRELIFKVVERRAKQGEPTLDLEDAAAARSAAGAELPLEEPGELARPQWSAPPPLEGTHPGAPGPVTSAAEGVAVDGLDERPTAEASGSEATPAPEAETAPAPAAPWEIATPWSATPTGPRWVATDASAAPSAGPDGDEADAEPDDDRDDELAGETIFVPPPPAQASSGAPSPAEPSTGGAARRRRRIGRGLAVAVVLVFLLGAGAYLSRDRWLGGGATAEAGEGGPGSQILLMPEELDPSVQGRGPGLSGAASGEGLGGGDAGSDGAAEPSELAGAATAADLAATPSPEPAARGAAEPVGGERAAASRPAAAPPARQVRDITWSDRGDRTDFLIWADVPLDPAAVSHFTIGGGKPRLVLRIPGVEEPFVRGRVEVGGRLVERIRTGLHAERGPSELHVVFDLTGGSVRLAGLDEAGGRLRVSFEEAGR